MSLGTRSIVLRSIGHLPMNLIEVLEGDALDLGARVPTPVDEPQQRPDLVEREAELRAPADEAQALDMLLAVQSVPPIAPAGPEHQPDGIMDDERRHGPDRATQRRATSPTRRWIGPLAAQLSPLTRPSPVREARAKVP